MITSARIATLKGLGGLSWITCLRAPAIKALAADDGPLQMSLFDTQDLAEITHPDYPGEQGPGVVMRCPVRDGSAVLRF